MKTPASLNRAKGDIAHGVSCEESSPVFQQVWSTWTGWVQNLEASLGGRLTPPTEQCQTARTILWQYPETQATGERYGWVRHWVVYSGVCAKQLAFRLHGLYLWAVRGNVEHKQSPVQRSVRAALGSNLVLFDIQLVLRGAVGSKLYG